MAYEYNPLLKNNLQKKADTASVEAEIDELKQSKITKFFSASDTLQDGEIAQYQGVDDPSNGLVNGYFYKCLFNPITIPVGTTYYEYSAQSDINNVGDINYNDFVVNYGDRLFLVDNNVVISPVDIYVSYVDGSVFKYFWFGDPNSLQIGDKAYNCISGVHCTFTQAFPNYVLSDGGSIKSQPSSYYTVSQVYKVLSSRGVYYYLVYYGHNTCYLLFELDSSLTNIVDWQPIFMSSGLTDAESIVNSISYVQSDSQPRIPGVTYENDELSIEPPIFCNEAPTIPFLIFHYDDGVTTAEMEMSPSSYGALALISDTQDGNIATIEDYPQNGAFVQYDSNNKQLKTITGLCLSNSGYVSNGQSLTLTISVSRIAYYQNAIWCVVGMGNVDSVSYLRIKHGDVWTAVLDDIVSSSYLSVASVTVNNSVATVVLSCNISGNNKYTFNSLSLIPINSITVN